MGNVVNQDGMRIWVWSNDHDPPHVHVAGAGWEVTVLIGDAAVLDGIKHGKPNGKQIRAAITLVAEYLEACNAEWRRCHG